MKLEQWIEQCPECGGYYDRPGKHGCTAGHPMPTLPQRIASVIEADLNDRRGLHINSLDGELQRKILDEWARLIEEELARRSSRNS